MKNFTESWIFLAIKYTCGENSSCELFEVIGAADFINHAIPTTREVNLALSKLTERNFVNVEDKRIEMTKLGRAQFTETKQRKRVHTELEELSEKLEERRVESFREFFNDDDLTLAYKDYTKPLKP